MKLPIRIMTRDFDLLGEVDGYDSLQITRSWHEIGMIEMRINRYKQNANKLNRGCIIFPHNHLNKGYVIRHKEIELDEKGKVTENWIIRALSLKSWLAQRLTMPPDHTAYDNKQGDAESVMLHYVANNVITPVNPARILPDIILADNLNRGSHVEWQSRYKNLAEEQAEIGFLSGLGWNVDIDYRNKQYVFQVLEGRNLVAGQSGLPPVIFSPEFDTLGELKYTESELDFKNYAVVAGQGEGVERRIVTVGESAGFERYELFVDARDVEEEIYDDEEGGESEPRPEADIIADLENRGRQKLAEHEQEIYMEGQALSKSRLVYERDYDLGDMVTLQNRGWGVTLDARITEVKEIYESGRPKKIELTFGNSRPELKDVIKRQLSGMKTELTR